MDDLLADFVAETREMLEAIGGELVAWEAEPEARARLDAIFRFVHTVKGNCGFFDFPRLERLSHAAESALAEVRAGRRQPSAHLVNAVLAIIDRITELVDAIENGETLPESGDERLVAALEPEFDSSEIAAQSESSCEEKPVGKAATVRSIRLPVELLDRLMNGVSDMVLARNDLARRLREAGDQPTVDGPFERLSAILDDVREGVTRMRMQRMEHLFNALPRLVRDLSSELGKQVLIDLSGGEVELDREMIETIRDPITHIIRNAVDHGIEKPSERLAKGKREIGLLSISARQTGNNILLIVSDDGGGLDAEKIVEKAIASGIAKREEVEAMSRDQQLDLIFEPGLSTAESVSGVSGRGVGMDVVRDNIQKVGGTIQIESRPGSGTTIFLQLPLTLSIISSLTVCSGKHRFAIPQSYVEEIARGSSNALEIERIGTRLFITFRGQRVPCIELSEVMGSGSKVPVERGLLVFVRLASDDIVALAADRVLDHEDLVVKPLAPAIMATGLYAGSTLLDDGQPILMLDVPSLAQKCGLVGQLRNRSTRIFDEMKSTRPDETVQLVLFSTLDGRRRAIRMSVVKRIRTIDRAAIQIEDDVAIAAVDGRMLPLTGYPSLDGPDGKVTVLVLSDGAKDLLYAVDKIEGTEDLAGDILANESDPLIEGSVLIDERSVTLLDGFALFARYGREREQQRTMRCRIPAGSDWARTFLKPMLEAAGYDVADDGDAEMVDVVLSTEDDEAESDAQVPVIRLCSSPDIAAAGAETIYRYDRDAMLNALKAISAGGT